MDKRKNNGGDMNRGSSHSDSSGRILAGLLLADVYHFYGINWVDSCIYAVNFMERYNANEKPDIDNIGSNGYSRRVHDHAAGLLSNGYTGLYG